MAEGTQNGNPDTNVLFTSNNSIHHWYETNYTMKLIKGQDVSRTGGVRGADFWRISVIAAVVNTPTGAVSLARW